MAQGRPPIPAELRRRVLLEAGHRCAIHTCRHIEVDIHHIIPWEQCKKHEYENLIALCPNCHRRADRGEIDRKSLKLYKANLRAAWDLRTAWSKFTPHEMDILFELSKLPANQSPNQCFQLPTINVLYIKGLLDANFVELRKRPRGVKSQFGTLDSYLLILTSQGRQYVKSLGVDWNN